MARRSPRAAVMAAELLFLKPRLSSTAKEVLALLTYRCGPTKDHCWPTTVRICDDLGLTKNTVLRCLQELEDRGAIRIEKHPGRRSIYHLVPLADWCKNCTGAETEPVQKLHRTGAETEPPPILDKITPRRSLKGGAPEPLLPGMDPAQKQTVEALTDARPWEFLKHPVPDEMIDNQQLRAAWWAWIAVRRKLKAKITEQGLNTSRKRLAAWGGNLAGAIDMLERAAERSWQGLYPPGDKDQTSESIDIPDEFK